MAEVSPYLKSYLVFSDMLPELLGGDVQADVVEDAQRRIRELVQLVAARDATIQKLER